MNKSEIKGVTMKEDKYLQTNKDDSTKPVVRKLESIEKVIIERQFFRNVRLEEFKRKMREKHWRKKKE